MAGTHHQLIYHIVFSTKNRKPYLQPQTQERVFEYMGGTVRGMSGIPLRIGGWVDHVHLLVKLPTTLAISNFVRELKSSTSHWVNETSGLIHKFGWQDGYGAFTVSRSVVEQVQRYIDNQAEHHRHQDFKTEYVALLDRHEVQYDSRYLWD